MKTKILSALTLVMVLSMIASSVLAAPAPPAAPSSDSTPDAGNLLQDADTQGPALYIVQLQDAPLASYYGGVESFAPTSPRVTGESKLNMDSEASQAYMDYLDGVQAAMLSTINQTLGRTVRVHAQWNVAYNGFAIEINPEEAQAVAKLEGVRFVQREFMRYPQTDVGPQWIGASNIWSGAATGTAYKGEGVIVGIVDTGLNLGHPSFADIGGDGYNHANPLGSGNYLGLCASNPGTYVCNDKTYGFYIFTGEVTEDGDGHGSHTGSTTAGNYLAPGTVDLTPFNSYSPAISGVAPHANVIGYKACLDAGGCPGAALVSAINQATANGVDVINYSIGGGTSNPWTDADALAFLAAQDAGVVPVTSAGNSGPGASTVGSPGDAPWMLTVGASTHNRAGLNAVTNMSGGNTTPPGTLNGKGFAVGYGPAPIVYAGNFGDALCLNPFAPGTFSGQIVVCDRGTNARVAKGYNVLQGGAGGMVLANTDPGQSMNGDVHWLPAVQINSTDGAALKAWLASGSGHTATIAGATISTASANGDIMAGFSSRGPLVNNASDVIKPDVTAPGVDVLAAYRNLPPGPEDPTQNYAIISGTSMSSPHTAGAAALLKGLHPTWSVPEIKSALMSTGKVAGVLKEDGVTQATPFDMGAGRVQVDRAAATGLVLDVAPGAFQAANPGSGGDPKSLNLASMGNDDCGGTCSWTRTVKATTGGTWTVSTTAPAGMTLTATPNSFSLNAGQTQQLTITANVTGLPLNVWAFAEVGINPTVEGSLVDAAVHFPVAVKPSSAVPDINVTPTSMASTQATNTTTNQMLNIGNTGASNLTWNIFEDVSSRSTLVDWSDNFDSYAAGSQLIGQGGWEGWGNNPAAGALVSNAQSHSSPNSAAIVGDTDLVHQYSGYTSGVWNYTAWQYIPTDFSGESYFILMNQYTPAGGGTGNWSTQVHFQSATNLVIGDPGPGNPGGTLPLVKGQWVPIRVLIDLNADTQTFYYNNQVLYTGSWTEGQSGGGSLNIAAVDLYANSASVVYYDDLALTQAQGVACDAPDDIPWASVAPLNGVTTPGATTPVNVTFDSTGLAVGTYNGTLCVESNDPVTPLVQVPLTLTVDDTVLQPVCSMPNVPIPDNTTGGGPGTVSDTITVPAGGSLSDLDFSTIATHTWVGDLKYVLTHVDTGTTVTLIDRPGVPATTFGCSGDNINATINDEGVDGNVETTCLAATPTIAGDLVGGDPANTSLLAAFDGENFAGDWTLTVSDNATGDTGTLNEWCLIPGSGAGGDPNIDVSPLSMASTQATNTSTNQPLTIANTGGGMLDWTIDEEDTTGLPQGPAVVDPSSASEDVSTASPAGASQAAPDNGVIWRAPEAVLWDNGPLVNFPGAGAGGADESRLQSTSLGMTTIGFGHQVLNNNWIADDFTISDAAGWTVNSATFFAYQTNSTTTSTMTNVNWILYNGDPSAGGTVITTGGGLQSTAWANMYRTTETTIGATSRPIMATTVNMGGLFLPAGAYWLAWQTDGTLASGPWAPPITINGQTTTGNGLQSLGNTTSWAPANDGGTLTRQGFPFILEGAVGGSGQPCSAPSDIPWLTLSATAGSNAGGTNTGVTVTFNSTGLADGVYTGNLCVTSNDPDAGPGNGTDLVIVPVTLTVQPPTAVTLAGLATENSASPAGAGVPLSALPAAAAAAFAAVYALRRRR